MREKTNGGGPLLPLDHLLIGTKGVTVSTDALALCCERGIPVTVVDWRGRPVGRFGSPALHGTAQVRRAQIAAFATEIGATFAREVVSGKLLNQADNLRYIGKNRKTRAPNEHEALTRTADTLQRLAKKAATVKGKNADDVRLPLMTVEAEGARAYWSVLSEVYGERSGFAKREQRGTRDPVNAALNYAYGVLNGEVWNATILAGLEPYAGFLHVDRPGRLSFVLDLMEEFRPVVADRVVFGLVAKGWKIGQEENGWLDMPTKRRLIQAIGERWGARVLHQARKLQLRSVLQLQARDAARHFQGKAEYIAFRLRW
ncbi:MAG: CRISPR-associated endonuclease Cas1 [Fimbriimonadaceae bacterium]|nr:CRISPR-associated endonuclease Cas1 [Fimbriimonadaceae bacterium]